MSPATHHHTDDPNERHAENALVTIATIYGAERKRLTQLIPVDAFTDPIARGYWKSLTDCTHVHVTRCEHAEWNEHYRVVDIDGDGGTLDDVLDRDENTCGAILLRDEIDALFDAPKYARQVLTNHAITLAERAHLARLDFGDDHAELTSQLEAEIAAIRRQAIR